MSLREKIIDYRAINSLTQTELAEKAGVSRDIIMALENESRAVKPVTMRKVEIFIDSQGVV